MIKNKKLLAVLLIVVLIALIGGFSLYEYVFAPSEELPNNINETPIETPVEQSNGNSVEDNLQIDSNNGIEVNGGNNGGLFICSDKCGDGICQAAQEKCDSINCTCVENVSECPQDCK